MNDVPYFEPDPFEPSDLGPELEALLRLAASQRRMDPSAYLAVLVDCDRRGVRPRWCHDLETG
jgi:hypothetical protein